MIEIFAILAVFGSLTTIVVVALLCFTVLGLVLTRRSFAYLDRALEVRRYEAELQLEQVKNLGAIPAWIDRSNPSDVAHWHAALAETYKPQRRLPTA